MTTGPYRENSIHDLGNRFPELYLGDIRSAFEENNFHYAPTRKALEESRNQLSHKKSKKSNLAKPSMQDAIFSDELKRYEEAISMGN